MKKLIIASLLVLSCGVAEARTASLAPNMSGSLSPSTASIIYQLNSVVGSTLTTDGGKLNVTGPSERDITSATDTILSTDGTKVVFCKNAAGCTVTLPAANSDGFLPAFASRYVNSSGSDNIFTSTTPIGDNYSLTVYPNEAFDYFSDTTNYRIAGSHTLYEHNPRFATLNPMVALDTRFTLTNTSTAACSYYNSTGILTSTTAGVCSPRFDYNPSTLEYRGLKVEAASENGITNTSFSGGSIGTSTLPTTWAVETSAGLTTTLTATGVTATGLPYMQLAVTGTATSASYILRYSTNYTPILASSATGTNWSASGWLGITGTAGITAFQAYLVETGGAFPSTASSGVNLSSSDLQLQTASRVKTTGGFPNWRSIMRTATGAAVNTTITIAAPQLEPRLYRTSFIPTLTTQSNVRQNDDLSLPTSGLDGRNGYMCGTFSVTALATGSVFSDGTTDRSFLLLGATNYGAYDGTNSVDFGTAKPAAGEVHRVCVRWSSSTGKMIAYEDGSPMTEGSFDGNFDFGGTIKFLKKYNDTVRIDGGVVNFTYGTFVPTDAQMATLSAYP